MSDAELSRAAGIRLRDEIHSHFGSATGIRSVRQLATKAGVQATTLTLWWTKGVVPDTATLHKVADALGVPLSRLTDAYGGKEDPVVDPDSGRVVLTPEELQEMMNRAAEAAVRKVLDEVDRSRRGA